MTRTITGNLSAFSLPAILVCLTGCSDQLGDPEGEIRAWVEGMEQAAERKARGDMMDGISEAYMDARGHSRDDVGDLLRIYFYRQNTVSLWSKIDEITVFDGTAAAVSISVGMVAMNMTEMNDSALGISADAYRFELELEQDGGDWQLISARWARLGDPLR